MGGQVIPTYEADSNAKKKFKRISSPEKWEIKQVAFKLYCYLHENYGKSSNIFGSK